MDREDYLHDVLPTIERYDQNSTRAKIYLESDNIDTLRRFENILRKSAYAIEDKALYDDREVRDIDWGSLDDALESSRNVLSSEHNDPIEELER